MKRTRSAKKRKGTKGSTTARTPRRWSARVTRTSNALDLERGVFSQRSARAIALSLKRSAQRSRRRKSEPFRSAMSMLNLYINRAGKKLSAERRRTLDRAKVELRRVFQREPGH
jgi:hypothetical protein